MIEGESTNNARFTVLGIRVNNEEM
jgi:hypothetical protein